MNYDAFMEPVTWFLTGMQKHSDDYRHDMLGNADAFEGMMRNEKPKMMGPSRYTSMNELSNHDHSRFLTRTNHIVGRVQDRGYEAAEYGVNKAVMREAVAIQMTWMGAPTIYYGDEAGVCGFTDPDNRRSYPWGNEDQELIDFHKEMIKIHKENAEIITGSTMLLHKDYNVIAYARFNKYDQIIVIVNNNDHAKDVDMRVWPTGAPRECIGKRLMLTSAAGFTTNNIDVIITNGRLRITMPATAAMIIKTTNGEKKETDTKKENVFPKGFSGFFFKP